MGHLGKRECALDDVLGIVKNWTERVTWILYVFYPPRIELWTLDETRSRENEKECVRAVLKLYIILEYCLCSKLSCCIRFIQGSIMLRKVN